MIKLMFSIMLDLVTSGYGSPQRGRILWWVSPFLQAGASHIACQRSEKLGFHFLSRK